MNKYETELVTKGVKSVLDSGDFFTSRIVRKEENNTYTYTLWINGSPIADCDTDSECRKLLAVILLKTIPGRGVLHHLG